MQGGASCRRAPAARAVVAWVTALCVVGVIGQLHAVDGGFAEAVRGGRRFVASVDEGRAAARAGLRVGDEVVGDPAGTDLTRPYTDRDRVRWALGNNRALRSGRYPLRVRRGRETFEAVLAPRGPTARSVVRQLARIALDLPTAFAFLTVATLLARSARRGSPRALTASAFALLGVGWVFNWPLAAAPAWTVWAYLVSGNLLSLNGLWLMAWLAWCTPSRAAWTRRRGLTTALFAAVNVAGLLSALEVVGWVPGPLPGSGLMYLAGMVGIALHLAGLVWQRQRARDEVERRQAAWLLAGALVGWGPPVALLGLPGLGSFSAQVAYAVVFQFPIAFPVFYAIGIARYRIFDVDALATKLGLHAATTATLASLYVVSAAAAERSLRAWLGPGSDAARWVGIAAVVSLASPVHARLGRWLDRAFGLDRAAFLADCARAAARAGDRPAAPSLEAAVCSELRAGALRWIDRLSPAAAEALDARRGCARALEIAALDDAVRALVAAPSRERWVLLAAPRQGGGGRVAAVELPVAVALLGDDEWEALRAVGRACGAALDRGDADRDLLDRVSRAEAERRQIAMELHDGVGSTLVSAQLMTGLVRRRVGDEAAAGPLEMLESTLRDGLAEMRLALWSLDDNGDFQGELLPRLRRYMADVAHAAGLCFALDVGDGLAAVTPAAGFAAARILREALTNTIKHARAARVRCALTVEGDALVLTYADDGVGLPLDAPRGRGLTNLAARAAALGGSVDLGAGAGRGMSLTARLPLRRAPTGAP
jgi:signal transduction histidine kinase